VRPSWNPKKIEEIVRGMVGNKTALFLSVKIALTGIRAGVALASGVRATAVRLVRRLPTQAFWRGEGYLVDSAHGGSLTHCAQPDRVNAELDSLGYLLLKVLGDDYPRKSCLYITDWYYYVFAKAEMPTS
jgi:hypothetical protein